MATVSLPEVCVFRLSLLQVALADADAEGDPAAEPDVVELLPPLSAGAQPASAAAAIAREAVATTRNGVGRTDRDMVMPPARTNVTQSRWHRAASTGTGQQCCRGEQGNPEG